MRRADILVISCCLEVARSTKPHQKTSNRITGSRKQKIRVKAAQAGKLNGGRVTLALISPFLRLGRRNRRTTSRHFEPLRTPICLEYWQGILACAGEGLHPCILRPLVTRLKIVSQLDQSVGYEPSPLSRSDQSVNLR